MNGQVISFHETTSSIFSALPPLCWLDDDLEFQGIVEIAIITGKAKSDWIGSAAFVPL